VRPLACASAFPNFAKRSAPPWRAPIYDAAMPSYVRLARPRRRPPVARRVPRIARLSRTIVRSPPPGLDRISLAVSHAAAPPLGHKSDPYLDYGRSLTPEGGVLIAYKDLDLRLRFLLWRIFAWTATTGFEAWFLFYRSPVQSTWINLLCLLAVAGVNFLIVWKPPELYRTVEIRPDCMIVEGKDVFWLSKMENGWPTFQPDEEGNQILSGIYGTRFVAYLTVRRFDDQDRAPEVFAAHLQDAMQQLWAPPERLGTRQGQPRWQG
jgi:hypothetical protein